MHPSDYPSIHFDLADACRDNDVGHWYEGSGSDAGAETTVFAATAQAADAFGIRPDILLDDDSPLSRAGGFVRMCYESLRFGEGGSIASPADGEALIWTNSGWESRAPRPINSRGQIGTLTGCGPGDAGVSDPVEPLLCSEPEPVPVTTPSDAGEPEAMPAPLPEDGNEPPVPDDDGVPLPSPDDPDAPGTPGSEPEPALDDDDAPPAPEPTPSEGDPGASPSPASGEDGEDTDRGDRGDSGARGSGVGLTGVGDSADPGCDCRVGARPRRSVAWLLGLPLLGLWCRRR
jgi:hypothetical protein